MKKLLLIIGLFFILINQAFCEEIPFFTLEKALMKYILSYQAYKKARQSSSKEIRANIPKFTKLYRESYAQYQDLLQKAKVYNPQKIDNNPAWLYNRNEIKKGELPILWKNYNAKKERSEVRAAVRLGIDAVKITVKNNIPKQPLSSRIPKEESSSDDNDDDDHDDDDDDDNSSSNGSNSSNPTYTTPTTTDNPLQPTDAPNID